MAGEREPSAILLPTS